MINLSTSLSDAIEDATQHVKPKVTARLSDSKLIDNWLSTSTSELYETQILKKSPALYWRFAEDVTGKTSTPDSSGNGISGMLTNITSGDSAIPRKDYQFSKIQDSFTRADSASNLGATSDGAGHSYDTVGDGIWGIVSNKAYISAYKNYGTPNAPMALIDSGGHNGYVQFTYGAAPTYFQGLVLRYVDSSNYVVWYHYNFIFDICAIVKVVAGVTTTVNTTLVTPANGDIIKFEAIDNSYVAYRNGIALNSATITDSVFATSTIQGMYHGSNASYSAARWDDLEIYTYNTIDRSTLFNGTTSKITSTSITALNTRMDYTISLWAKPSSVAGTQNLLSYENSGAGLIKWRVYLSGGSIVAEFYDNSGTVYSLPGGAASVGSWYNIVLRKSGTAIDCFINGVKYSSSSMIQYILDLTTGSLNAGMRAAGTNPYSGYLDEVSVFTKALTDKEIELLYSSALNVGTFTGVEKHFIAEQAFNGFDEESLAWAVTGSKTEYGSTITTCGEYYLIEEDPIQTREYGVWSRTKSDSSGNFSQREEFWIEFDDLKCNKIELSTGYHLGRVKSFTYYLRKTDGTIISASNYFDYNTSVKEITLSDTYDIDAIGIKFNSTWNPSDHAILYQFNPVYDVDISEYVISFSVSKVRDNYDSTLPVGLTGSNSGDIQLDNTSQVFNIYDPNSIYGKYMVPETRISLSLTWMTEADDAEEVVIYDGLYIDHWSMSSDSMTLTGSGRDWSKYSQDEAKSSGVYERVTAGRAIANIMKSSGFPNRKIVFYDTYYRSLTATRPQALWRFSDITSVLKDSGGNYNGTYTGGYSQGKASIINSEKTAINYTVNRVEASTIVDEDKSAIYSALFDGASGTYASVPDASSLLAAANDWSILMSIQPTSLPVSVGDISFFGSKYNVAADKYNYALGIKKTSGGYTFLGRTTSSSGTTYTLESSTTYTSAQLLNNTFTIALTKDDLLVTLYVNGSVAATTTTNSFTSYTSTDSIVFADRKTGVAGDQFTGYIGAACIWSRPLTATEINSIYISSSISGLYIFEYLFYYDSTTWDAILEFATADLGMFYFDEDENFRYEYSDIFHDGVITRHNEVQKEISDDEHIISGSYDVDVQTNSITVNVNPIVTAARSYDEIWRAEDGSSLAVTKITSLITGDQTTVPVSTTDDPLWYTSGYLKIDDEIMSYSGKTATSLTGVVRGLWGTLATEHANNSLCREVRVFDIEYTTKPAANVKFPFIKAKIFDGTIDIEKYKPTENGCKLILSANKNNVEGDLVVLQGRNPLTDLDNFMAISGIVIKEKASNEKVIKETKDIASNLRKQKKKELIIDNKFIQDKAYADKIAEFIIKFFSFPVSILSVDVIGMPQLELGDLIRITKFDQLGITNKDYWIIENSVSYDGGLTQSLKLREFVEGL